MKYRVKRDTEVVVISGEHKGKRGKVLKVLRDSQQVIIEGVNLHKKCIKKTQENPKGSIVEQEMPIHYSNVKVVASSEPSGGTQGKGKNNE
jgi:large subunit ribosomal protein L24